jgi:hypothetical protein
VDTETGHLYVADSKNNRVDVFDSNGNFIRAFGWGVADGSSEAQVCTIACRRGIAGSGPGQFNHPTSLAVDSNQASTSFHDVYVGTDNFRVQKFDSEGKYLLAFGSEGFGDGQFMGDSDPIAVGPGGVVYIGDRDAAPGSMRVEQFDPAGAFLKTVVPESPTDDSMNRLAVESSGGFFASFNKAAAIHEYDKNGNIVGELDPSIGNSALAIDSADNLFAGQREEALFYKKIYSVLTEYSPSSVILRRWGYGLLDSNVLGLAKSSSESGDVFASQEFGEFGIRSLAFPQPGPITIQFSAKAWPIRSTRATLKAEINPEGKEATYRVDYVNDAGFKANGFGGATVGHSPESAVGGANFKLHGVSFQATGLTPNTKYHFRVVATNADGSSTVEGESFETLPPLEVGATWSTEVGTDTATLHGEANPLGSPTAGFLEYVDDAHFQLNGFSDAIQVPDIKGGQGSLSFGSGEELLSRGVALYPLAAGTTYHYRLTASNLFSTLVTQPRTFTTFRPVAPEACPANESFRTGPSGGLPDCRAYELVSPLEKASGDVVPLGEFTTSLPATLDQSSLDGDKLSYGSYRAFADAQSSPFTSQYIAERSADGWQSHTITPPRGRLNAGASSTFDTELKALSPDLCEAWLLTVAEAPLAPEGVPGYRNLYRRKDSAAGCPGQSYEALTTTTPPHTKPHAAPAFFMEFQGISADGSTALFTANDNLPGTLASNNLKGTTQLYMSNAEGLSYLCILPGEKVSKEACSAGTPVSAEVGGGGQNRAASVNNAVSADGQKVFWTSYTSVSGGPGQIYLRIGGSETVAVSKAAEAQSGTTESRFLTAAKNGSKAIFITGKDLYEYDTASHVTGLIAHKVAGIVGSSEDASRIYLVSEDVLSGANTEGSSPIASRPNLYLEHEGDFTFVATLAAGDANPTPQGGRTSPIALVPALRTSRVSPDGLHVAFMSVAAPTGYDNIDAESGETDAEVYRYDADADAVVCASCNPSGARPVGAAVGAQASSEPFWAAAQISGWENTTYAARNLSADGSRLFFESTDALSPRDANGVGDVYQWEEPGSGGCTKESSSYSAANGGCLSLISSGLSVRKSTFTDASPNGRDVFVATLSSLLPEDYGLVDIYDARVGGGTQSPPLLPVQCEGEACQPPSAAPPTTTPSSAVFQGPGDPTAVPKLRCLRGKVRTKRRGCVKKKHIKKQRKANDQRRTAR